MVILVDHVGLSRKLIILQKVASLMSNSYRRIPRFFSHRATQVVLLSILCIVSAVFYFNHNLIIGSGILDSDAPGQTPDSDLPSEIVSETPDQSTSDDPGKALPGNPSESDYLDDPTISDLPSDAIPPDVTADPPEIFLPEYDYSLSVSENTAVDDDYFSDAVFIGDSRTDGLRLYGGLITPTYLSAKSISVLNIEYEDVIPAGSGTYVPILTALSWNSYAKVYIMLGINEIGLTPSSFSESYSKLIDSIREIQPDAIIYLQAIIPVDRAKENSGTVYNNENIQRFNEEILNIANEKHVYYVDTYTALADEDGFLPDGASYDGVHLMRTYCENWRDYLKTHTIDPSCYAPCEDSPEETSSDEPMTHSVDTDTP